VTVSYKRLSIRFCKKRVPRPHRALTAPSAPRHTPRIPRHALNKPRFARPPLRSRAASIKRPGTEQAGPDPTVSTGVLGYGNQVLIKRIRVFSTLLRTIRKHVLGFQFRSSWDSGVLGLTPACRARAFSALSPFIIRLGRSRPYSCLQSSGVLGSASAYHKAQAFSALFLLTKLGCSRLCLRLS